MFKNTPLYHRLKAIIKLDKNQLFRLVFNNSKAKDLIIDLNTQKQLKQKGINSKGDLLSSVGGRYSPVTMSMGGKKSAYLVDLHDTGDFYRSFQVIVSPGQVEIVADTIKDDDDLTVRWGDDILGLTEKNMQVLQDFAVLAYQDLIRKKILV